MANQKQFSTFHSPAKKRNLNKISTANFANQSTKSSAANAMIDVSEKKCEKRNDSALTDEKRHERLSLFESTVDLITKRCSQQLLNDFKFPDLFTKVSDSNTGTNQVEREEKKSFSIDNLLN